jgi:hypothetical protein
LPYWLFICYPINLVSNDPKHVLLLLTLLGLKNESVSIPEKLNSGKYYFASSIRLEIKGEAVLVGRLLLCNKKREII